MSVAMVLDGAPNDLIFNFNPLAIIIFTPIITYLFYPFMDRIGRPLKPMTTMCIGYLLGTVGCSLAANVQWKVCQTSPCGYYATTCDDVSIVPLWWQIPIYFFPGVGELFVNVTSYELAYTRSPARSNEGFRLRFCPFQLGYRCRHFARVGRCHPGPQPHLALGCLGCRLIHLPPSSPPPTSNTSATQSRTLRAKSDKLVCSSQRRCSRSSTIFPTPAPTTLNVVCCFESIVVRRVCVSQGCRRGSRCNVRKYAEYR